MPANFSSISDAELIHQSRNGDEAAYGQIVQRYQSLVCSVAYNRCGDLAMSEDLAQDAFIQAWKKLSDLSDATKFKSWICTIVRNMASRSHANATRNVTTGAARIDTVIEPASSADNPVQRVISDEQQQMVWQALAAIPENYREPMILFYREDQSVARVAEALEISQDAVKQRLSRGRKFLQQQIAATVETTLENSKPSQAFTGAVMLGLSGAKAKTATVAAAAGVAAKAPAAGAGLSGFLLPLAQLPVVAWLVKTSWDETRSKREQKVLLRYCFFCVLGLISMVILMYGTIPWRQQLQPRWLGSLVIPAIMFLYYIPVIIAGRRYGKQIKQLRIEENTATPHRNIVANPEQRGSVMRLFVGSGLLITLWPATMPTVAGDWICVGLLVLSTVAISLVGARFCGSKPVTSFRIYACSLAAIAFIGIGVMYFRKSAWSDSFSAHSSCWTWIMLAMVTTLPVLQTVVWKRVYGKPK